MMYPLNSHNRKAMTSMTAAAVLVFPNGSNNLSCLEPQIDGCNIMSCTVCGVAWDVKLDGYVLADDWCIIL